MQAHIGSSMDLPVQVPVCPLGRDSALAQHLRISGWIWDDESLVTVVNQLAREDVCCINDFVGFILMTFLRRRNGPMMSGSFC